MIICFLHDEVYFIGALCNLPAYIVTNDQEKLCARCASNMPLSLFNVGAKNFYSIAQRFRSDSTTKDVLAKCTLHYKPRECHDYFRFKYLISYNKNHFKIFHLVTYAGFQVFCLPYSKDIQADFPPRMEIVNESVNNR